MNQHLSQEAMAIKAVIALRDRISERAKEDALDKEAKAELEDFLYGVMVERGEKEIKTEDGTAYQSPQMRATMIDRQAVIAYVCDELEKGNMNAFELFTNHVNKDVVREMLQRNMVPPGIEVNNFVQCNVRRNP